MYVCMYVFRDGVSLNIHSFIGMYVCMYVYYFSFLFFFRSLLISYNSKKKDGCKIFSIYGPYLLYIAFIL